jgi:uncharacterized protein (DUF2267 family)
MFARSLVLTDELINEFVEENKDKWVDPDQYPAIFTFRLKSFLFRKGLLNG